MDKEETGFFDINGKKLFYGDKVILQGKKGKMIRGGGYFSYFLCETYWK